MITTDQCQFHDPYFPGGDSEENKKDNEEAEMDGELGQEERGTS